MKMKELPKAPIQLQRDALLLEVAHLKNVVSQKDLETSAFKNEITNLSSQVQAVNILIGGLQSQVLIKSNEVTQKENSNAALLLKEQELLNKISLLEKTHATMLQSIDELKIDKLDLRKSIDELKIDKLDLRQLNADKDIKIEYQKLELEQLNKMFNESSIANNSFIQDNLDIPLLHISNSLVPNQTVESIYPSEKNVSDSSEVKIELSGNITHSFDIID